MGMWYHKRMLLRVYYTFEQKLPYTEYNVYNWVVNHFGFAIRNVGMDFFDSLWQNFPKKIATTLNLLPNRSETLHANVLN